MAGDQKRKSRKAVLDAIRESSGIARIDVARNTGISQATVTTITAEMLRDGLIETVNTSGANKDSARGRPRVDLKLRGNAHIVAGVKLANTTMSVVILDFEGNLLAEHAPTLEDSVYAPQALADTLRGVLADACALANIALDDLSAVGLGMAGIVDAPRGFVYWSPSLNGRNVDLQPVLEKELGVPFFIDNDANLVAMAEQYFGEGRGVKDFLVVTVESGVGMGIVINNKLFRGTRGCGAEFGHTKVQLDGALCRCGQRGCLEAYVADYALLREASVASGRRQQITIPELLESAREGDEMSKSIVTRASRMFAMGLANLANIFDPELIILSGERMQMDHLYANDVIDRIREATIQIDMPPPRVVIHKWGDLMWARGAAAFAIDAVADMAIERLCEVAD
ncbi:ROK family transcriptional regulator [Actibacterium mucosum KCTC 23349]|uniref:ROK family transcriptional regulator n=1 Tax=Actibacterium mucosum KCTC 23349 TaxID=1454373 RepID=A0A037ZLR1_9RHOB|nr:ROK family transcriptional regulator [Actibacterium mucosum]KAJ57034.1 ROK family transcriptional regulator [Actibacterium mucosum KCTC 23349]